MTCSRHGLPDTGDLVRQATDGTLFFVGRKDTQVKLQGMRFEATETEARCSWMLSPGSKFGVEKVEVPLSPGRATLAILMITSIKASGSELPEVRWDLVEDFLIIPGVMNGPAKSLPALIIPSFYIPLTFIPLTWSQKMERKGLRQLFKHLGSQEV